MMNKNVECLFLRTRENVQGKTTSTKHAFIDQNKIKLQAKILSYVIVPDWID